MDEKLVEGGACLCYRHRKKREIAALRTALAIALALPSIGIAGDWSTGDTVHEAVYGGLLAADCGMTRNASQHPQKYRESDPLVTPFLGHQPSTGRVDNLCAVTALGHVAVSVLLPRPWRETFQYVTIGAELYAVGHQYSIGLRIAF